jgi:hypothetical protein
VSQNRNTILVRTGAAVLAASLGFLSVPRMGGLALASTTSAMTPTTRDQLQAAGILQRIESTVAEISSSQKLLQFARMNADAFKGTGSVTLHLPNHSLTMKGLSVLHNSNGTITWKGTLPQEGGDATFVVRKGQVTGSVSARDGIFSVTPSTGGVAVVTKLDYNKLPPEHPASFERTEERARSAYQSQLDRVSTIDRQRDVRNANSNIGVLVGYTAGVLKARPDVASLIQLAVDEANESYRNSGVHITLVLKKTMQVNTTENGSFDADLKSFVNDAEVQCQRATAKADVAVLLITDDAYCGLADDILAKPNTAFAVVYHGCATGYYSFAHEIGHLQGARHNPEADPGKPYEYGHGYTYPAGGWRTIMGYACTGTQKCDRRIKYWSNPNVNNEGAATGSTNVSNNARVLNETAAYIASLHNSLVPNCRHAAMST